MSSDFQTLDDSVLSALGPLRAAGFALHWLHEKSKRPIGKEWQEAAVADIEQLRATHRAGNNLGVRLGQPSQFGKLYWHVIDADIRIESLSEEAQEAFATLFPDLDIGSLPSVQSGSGGSSRHWYFLSDKAFGSRKLAQSEGKFRGTDGKWHREWEIELFGTGKQVVLPPSIHPVTGKPYVWERPLDRDMLDLGIAPYLPAAVIEAAGVLAADEQFAFETREPLDFKPGQMERDLDILDISSLDYDDWLRLGQALHHQFGGSDAGFQVWLKQSQRSIKHDGDVRTMRRKYRSFGRYRGQPVTMATIRQWAAEIRVAELQNQFDEEDEEPENDDDTPTAAADPYGDLFGDDPVSDDDDFTSTSERITAPEASKLDWVSLLDLNEEGAIKPTLHNVEMIVKNDVRLAGLPQMNQFSFETVQRVQPGIIPKKRARQEKPMRQLTGDIWKVKDTRNGEIWSSARDAAIRSILEAPKTQGGYGIKLTDRDLKAAIVLAAWDNAFHPVREYLESLTWDGKPRVERLFVEYLGSPDNAYTRDVARLMMIAAVTRIYEPGHKWDFAVILEGLQGRGKSTFINILGKDWSSELEGDFHDGKEMVEKMQNAWIMEIPELSGFNRTDVRSIKAFISRQVDKVRLAYEARAQEFPRQCIMIGSTNDREYLKDDTGGRRFFPMECRVRAIDTKRLRAEVDHYWAEAVTLYSAMRAEQPEGTLPLYLDGSDAATEAARLQESRRVESSDDALIGRISSWLDTPIRSGDITDESEGRYREITCLVEIWAGLGNDPRAYGATQAQSLGRAMSRVPGWENTGKLYNFPAPFGRQRAYERTI